MNNDRILTGAEPDPSWDYYEIWNQLIEAKVEIDRGLSLIKMEEVAQTETDFLVNEHIKNAITALQVIVVETDL